MRERKNGYWVAIYKINNDSSESGWETSMIQVFIQIARPLDKITEYTV
jgi:hypothetical protein